MRETLVKLVLLIVGVLALACGLVFLVAPDWFVTISGAESSNVGWLRLLGAAVAVVHGLGLLIVSFRRRDTNLLLFVITFATSVMEVSLWLSIFTKEFSAERSWTTILPAIVGTAVAVALWVAWLARRRTVGDLADRPQRGDRKAQPEKAGAEESIPETPAPEEGENDAAESESAGSDSADSDSSGDDQS